MFTRPKWYVINHEIFTTQILIRFYNQFIILWSTYSVQEPRLKLTCSIFDPMTSYGLSVAKVCSQSQVREQILFFKTVLLIRYLGHLSAVVIDIVLYT